MLRLCAFTMQVQAAEPCYICHSKGWEGVTQLATTCSWQHVLLAHLHEGSWAYEPPWDTDNRALLTMGFLAAPTPFFSQPCCETFAVDWSQHSMNSSLQFKQLHLPTNIHNMAHGMSKQGASLLSPSSIMPQLKLCTMQAALTDVQAAGKAPKCSQGSPQKGTLLIAREVSGHARVLCSTHVM